MQSLDLVTRRHIVNRRHSVSPSGGVALCGRGKGIMVSRFAPASPILEDYAALALISIVFDSAAFGMFNCRTPFFKVAVVFSASTVAGRSTVRRI